MPKWLKVSKAKPCPICGKPDWCMFAPDQTAVLCQRVESPKKFDGGYFHWINGPRSGNAVHRPKLEPVVKCGDWRFMNERYRKAIHKKIDELAASLKLAVDDLAAFEAGWDGEAYTFPMRNALNEIVGIRRRFLDGRKTAVPGSKNGLFIPQDVCGGLVFLPEGPTDAAALHSVGLCAVGRPACHLGEKELVALCSGKHPVVVADRDTPGENGAKKLADALHCRVIQPKAGKDIREWSNSGATREDVLSLVGTDRRLT